jgi:hypothetical protein
MPNGPCQPPKNNVTSRAEINGDTDVLTHEEHAPFHAGIFNVVTVGQFLLGFRLVETGDGESPQRQQSQKVTKPKNCGMMNHRFCA